MGRISNSSVEKAGQTIKELSGKAENTANTIHNLVHNSNKLLLKLPIGKDNAGVSTVLWTVSILINYTF